MKDSTPNSSTPDTPNGFGKLIRRYREQANLTQQQLKNRLDVEGYPVAKSAICMWENGQRTPSLLVVHYLSEALRLDIEKETALLNARIIDRIVGDLVEYQEIKKGLSSPITYGRIMELINQTLQSVS